LLALPTVNTFVKGIVHPKMKTTLKFTLYEFLSSVEQKIIYILKNVYQTVDDSH